MNQGIIGLIGGFCIVIIAFIASNFNKHDQKN